MSQDEKAKSKGWLKNVLRFIALLMISFLVLIFVGVFASEYLQHLDILAFFIKTQWIWFAVRFVLYGVIMLMVFNIARRNPALMSVKAKWLIAMVLVFAEAITQITLA